MKNSHGLQVLDTPQQFKRRRKLRAEVAALRQAEQYQRIQFRIANNPNINRERNH